MGLGPIKSNPTKHEHSFGRPFALGLDGIVEQCLTCDFIRPRNEGAVMIDNTALTSNEKTPLEKALDVLRQPNASFGGDYKDSFVLTNSEGKAVLAALSGYSSTPETKAPPRLNFRLIITSVGGPNDPSVTMRFAAVDAAEAVHHWLATLQEADSPVETFGNPPEK